MCAGQQSPPPLPGFSYDGEALALAGNKAIQEADIPRGYGRGGARMRAARINEVRQSAIAAEKERQRNAYYKQQQARADAIAARRKEIAADQQRRQSELQAQSIAAQQAQRAEVERLKRQQDERIAGLASNAAAQQAQARAQSQERIAGIKRETSEKVAGINRAGGAAATSLRVLAQKQPTAPQAVQTPRGRTRRGAGSTQANVARGAASSRGTNLSI